MSMIETFDLADFGGAVKKTAGKFTGVHPSVIMWSKGPAPQAKTATGVQDDGFDFQDLFGGSARKLSEIVSGGNPQPELFNTLKFDAIISEDHIAQSVVTKFPVSSGFVVSDHVIKQNRILKLTAMASNMQNSAMWAASVQGISVVTGAIFNSPILPVLGGVAGAVATAFETEDRVRSVYQQFRDFQGNGTKLYISTIAGQYLNCVVTEIKTRHDKMTQSVLAVEVTFEELQVIDRDDITIAAQKALDEAVDYSQFTKIAQGLGIGVLGGLPLPGLGSINDSPTKQLSNLKDKLNILNAPVSAVKGRLS